MKRLDEKIAIVTAASRGIGFACAHTLAMNGALVYIAGIEEEGAIEKILEDGGQAKFIYFNAKEKDSYFKMIDTVYENEGKIDILVNNYGATNVKLDRNLVDGDTDAFFDILKSNIESVYLTSKRTVPYMIKNGGGSIINISSVGSIVPDLSRMAYCVSKSAINSLTQNIALQYAKQNIRCNAVLPGLIATKAALNNMSDEFRESFVKHVPLNRVGNPQDIANTVLYYASDESNYVTGMIHEVAGGFALGTPQYAEYMYLMGK
ncbi:TPA: SDR family oxidoreductase [Clostridium perfringens]|uniref:NADP-dependent 7-alpha-hydroxysteroid dehydrogenase n=1 Tax=Clostridium perfringens TaxID=1502 RepID=A0A4Y5T4A8_CLOPF|nr:SDR family oxidoreductase [Clostridium perfringens]MDM0935999.1 SDR family oxidoreductase [Clostridium perfringens]PWX37380.1 oxidoreductase [Clostridium perfringens]PWX53018.1 oxidoreductase [Clostridium perfringens]QDB01182.1 NADP-dependent 7-alpha-hydroxysteroid dehydrogenase [Clostridium perfringens]HAT4262515.1 SDR family oxidoreductase [Clostridium perfringens]